jgi:hypothetical protein
MTPECIQAQLDISDFIIQSKDIQEVEEGGNLSINMLCHLYNENLKEKGKTGFLSMISLAMLSGEQYGLSLYPNDKGRQVFFKLSVVSQPKSSDAPKSEELLKRWYEGFKGQSSQEVKGEKAMVGGRKALSFRDFSMGYNEANPDRRLTFRYIRQKLEEWGDYASENGKDWVLF